MTLNIEIPYHERCYIVLIQISDCQMLKCWQMIDLFWLMASEGMTGTNDWLASANGIRMDDRDK
jgi:hypothetical protein